MQAKDAGAESKYSILGSQPRARMLSLEYGQLLTEGKDLETEVVAGTQECAEGGEKTMKNGLEMWATFGLLPNWEHDNVF